MRFSLATLDDILIFTHRSFSSNLIGYQPNKKLLFYARREARKAEEMREKQSESFIVSLGKWMEIICDEQYNIRQKKKLHVYANDSICQNHCYLYVCVYNLGMDRKSDPHAIHRGKTEQR